VFAALVCDLVERLHAAHEAQLVAAACHLVHEAQRGLEPERLAIQEQGLVDQLADEFQGKVKVGKVDIDDNQGIAQKYGIRGVPTLYVFKGGEVVGKMVGAAPKQNIAQLMQRAL
jgi:protein-disulfide isomerase